MKPSSSQQIRHARYIDPSVPYHVVTKTLRGQFILAPKKGIQAKGTRRDRFLFNYDMCHRNHLGFQAGEVGTILGIIKVGGTF